jgi:dTDP-4-dehydrorhamnose reductase
VPGLLFLDLTDCRATERLVGEIAPDAVFCAGALTHVDYCEEHPEEAFRLHRDASAAAARAAAKQGAAFVYYSTDYVFDGESGPYGEDDPVHPLSVYGLSKLEGERAVLGEDPRALVIRTTVVYGPEPQGKNTVYQLLRRGRAREPMRAPSDQVTSPTYNADLAAASVELVERGRTGVLNVAGAGMVDRHAFARLVCRVFALDETLLEPVTTEALRQRAPRPLRGGLRIDRARTLLSTPLRGPEEGLRAMRAALEGGSAAPRPSLG